MSLKYIREHYNVPAFKGSKVLAIGKLGTITGSSGPHLRIRLDSDSHSGIYHPTWKMNYVNQYAEIVYNKKAWIGGILTDYYGIMSPDSEHNRFKTISYETTKITDISLIPNGKDSAMFAVEGETFSCKFDINYGVSIKEVETCIHFTAHYGLNFSITPHVNEEVS